jgi:hypothetical protein
MRRKVRLRLARLALAGSVLLLAALPAFSQNCALCYTQAASAGARMIEALRSGILILIIPPTLASIGMIFVVHHKRNQVRRTEYGGESGPDDW